MLNFIVSTETFIFSDLTHWLINSWLMNHWLIWLINTLHSSTRRSWFTNGMAGSAELDRGRGLRAKCKSLSKPTRNHHERRRNNSFENVFQRFVWSFVSFLRRKHDFRRRISTFVWLILLRRTQNLNLWFQPENSRFEVRDRKSRTFWHAQRLSCCENTCGWRPWYQERQVLKFFINAW